jgi:hypothetical protein
LRLVTESEAALRKANSGEAPQALVRFQQSAEAARQYLNGLNHDPLLQEAQSLVEALETLGDTVGTLIQLAALEPIPERGPYGVAKRLVEDAKSAVERLQRHP